MFVCEIYIKIEVKELNENNDRDIEVMLKTELNHVKGTARSSPEDVLINLLNDIDRHAKKVYAVNQGKQAAIAARRAKVKAEQAARAERDKAAIAKFHAERDAPKDPNISRGRTSTEKIIDAILKRGQ